MSTLSNTHDTPTRGPAKPLPYIISGVLLAIAVVVPLVVPIYSHAEPHLGGIPFFYWYQMLWVPIDAALIGICYVLMTREDRRRRDVLKRPAGRGSRADNADDGGEGR
ncbi:DUF3311 domain-containing protein [Specibacter cremeus]|uniref:DUF3311 domain-containing protein n=1 Tax=Specibacter cremeus TaxID=1629051 RepID=UPI000F7A0B14|nr:DUF3311 domain-containing protein [Specibacter cremeus]